MPVTISGSGLTISAIDAVARGAAVELSRDPEVLGRVERFRDRLQLDVRTLEAG